MGLELEERGFYVRGRVTLRLLDPITGEEKKRIETPNMIVDSGLEFVAQMLIATDTLGLTYIAIGNDNTAAAAGQTTLVAEQARALCFQRAQSSGTLTISSFWSTGSAAIDIVEVGAFGGADASGSTDSGTLFARTVVTGADNSVDDYDVSIDWSFTIARS